MSVEEISGDSGALSGLELLDAFQTLEVSGTLVLEHPQGSTLTLLQNGVVRTSFELGDNANLSARNQHFMLRRHPPQTLPELASRYPGSNLAPLRALPTLSRGERLEAVYIGLNRYVEQLGVRRFSGTLTVTSPEELGLMLFLGGKLAAAFHETRTRLRRGEEALRAISKQCAGEDADQTRLEKRGLEPQLAACLLGLASQQRDDEPGEAPVDTAPHAEAISTEQSSTKADATDNSTDSATDSADNSTADTAEENAEDADTPPQPRGFSGTEVSAHGYSYYQDGECYLLVRSETHGDRGRYRLRDQIPSLTLPDEPPGWEAQRYRLTLRGKDALNPMMELSQEFTDRYGSEGTKILRTLGQQLSAEEVAFRLELSFSSLRTWLDRLEGEGLIRKDGRDPDASPNVLRLS
ncbi:MAG: hypothetical protein U5L04_14585 [Trueperaceae bacterium]|nr:hypothetical protein [Trueperaceae bacterium]